MDLKGYNLKIASDVNSALEKALSVGDQKTLREAMMHLPMSGGKRMRPMLAILVADAISGSGKKAMPLGLALEIIHNFTLVHDDIMDKDDFRRGVPTVHKKWDEPTAINAGDALFARAIEVLSTLDAPLPAFREIVHDVACMVRQIGEGQQWDMEFETQKKVTEAQYIKMIERKTALMFMTGAKGGAMIGLGTDEQVKAMWEYGRNLGIGFQIHDDWLNLAGDPKEFQKPIGGDLLRGKKTIIMLHAIGTMTKAQLAPVMKIYGKEKATKVSLGAAIKALAPALEYAHKTALAHAAKAVQMLEVLPDSEHKQLLKALALYAVERKK
jgi:geranylgeranyl diphosphate synthase, type I